MRVRPARPEDAAAIADVHVRSWQTAYEHIFGSERLATLDFERRRAGWADAIERGHAVLVAEDDGGAVVGFVSVGDGELYAIYVRPEAWGTGAGPALMGEATRVLAADNDEAVLWVLEDNARARRFYEREGWTLDGGTKDDEFLGVEVREVRYRISLSG
jgi:ribosomal protein S18 acetylase RimI-like enzyme